jgi:murein DD-endopeptidase MepM/ murein hydrolase activator NlpD
MRSPNADNRSNLGFIMPIKYTGITSPQGNRFHPVLKRYIYHAGVDLRAHFIPLYASKEGKVTFAGTMNGYGKIIIIQHSGGYETRYGHLDKIGVRKGQYVKTGELIGKTGQSGRVTGPHLHFELRKNGKALNPMKYMPKSK